MHAKKLVKWGVALTSTLVLGGMIAPVGDNLVTTSAVVYAEEVTWYTVEYYLDGQLWGTVNYGYRRGWPYVKAVPDDLSFPNIDEIELVSSPIADPWRSTKEEIIATGGVLRYYWVRKGGVSQPSETPTEKPVEQPVETPVEQPVDQPAETKPAETKPAETPTEKPAEQPVETPTEQPVEQPAETPTDQPTVQPVSTPTDQSVEQPISVLIGAISEVDGPLSHYYVTINPGETKTVEAPKVDGYKLDQYTSPTYELTYDYALRMMNSGGFAWVQFWMIKDTAPETPVDQPAEKPVEQPVETPIEQPVEQPVEKPAETLTAQPTETPAEKPVATPTEKPAEQPFSTPTDQPTEKPTATSLLAGNTTSKAQTVATTDKKKVDNSTPSTNAVKPEEGSQATAKTLPKTGDSSSMLLVLGGLLSGLSGLGLAATSRKRD
ncbi:TPA: LPXTG cell wall anchor domain-containing protein [Streptococcus suis]